MLSRNSPSLFLTTFQSISIDFFSFTWFLSTSFAKCIGLFICFDIKFTFTLSCFYYFVFLLLRKFYKSQQPATVVWEASRKKETSRYRILTLNLSILCLNLFYFSFKVDSITRFQNESRNNEKIIEACV